MKLNAMKLEMEIIEALFKFWGEDHIEQPCTPLGNNQMLIPTGIDATPFSLNTTQSETDVRPGVGGSWYTNYTTLDDNSDVPSINYVLDFAVKYTMENEGNKISTNQQDKKNICLELEESKSVVAEKEIEIQRLKGLLTHEDEGFKARLMEKMEQYVESYLKAYRLSQGALHEKQLKQKDEEIKLLRAQNKELKTRLTELIVPTPTQVCENPENLARLDMLEQLHVAKKQNESLLKKNVDLLYTIETFETIDNHPRGVGDERTTCLKRKQVKHYPEPSTMMKRGKDRTVKDNGKSVEITPHLNTREIIQIHKGDNPKEEMTHMSDSTKFCMDRTYDAVRKTTSDE
ncbi:hypothetical protein ACS0TY_006761 [Phlomoides rotata]